MKMLRLISIVLTLALLGAGLASTVQAEPRRGNDRSWSRDSRRGGGGWSQDQRHAHDNNWVMDRRYHHDRFYPRRGYRLHELPRGYRVFRRHHERYFFSDGIWYRPGYGGFFVVTPPIGLTVSLLPPYYTTIWADGVPYYYANDVYYRWLPTEQTYVVSAPPPAKDVVEDSNIPKDLYIYPMKGQSTTQQQTDRYQCYRWAVKQTGFDPTQPGGNVPAAQNTTKRSDYQRAMKACLEGRGYSVQ